MFWSFALIFAFCELGAKVTNKFHSLDEEVYQSNWYSLPVEVRRMMVIFMSGAQQPDSISSRLRKHRMHPNVCILKEKFEFEFDSQF